MAFVFPAQTQTIPYSQFKQSMTDGNVDDLIISPEKIHGTLKGTPAKKFDTVRVDDPGLAKEMDELRIQYSGRAQNRFWGTLFSWVLPLGFLF